MTPPRSGATRSGPPPRLTSLDWKAVGLRRTPQREIILGLVQSSHDHPTAEWLHQEARQILPVISLATVYRTLRTLKEKGLVYEFSGGASPSRYDGRPGEHEHVHCVRCGAVENVTLPELDELRERVAARTGFRMGHYPMVFHGLCESCTRVAGDAGANGPRGGDEGNR